MQVRQSTAHTYVLRNTNYTMTSLPQKHDAFLHINDTHSSFYFHIPHTAMKALEQRQAALERSEKEVVVAEDELSRLQRGLTEFMSRDGVVTGETYDARRSDLI